MVICPFCGVNFTALLIRFKKSVAVARGLLAYTPFLRRALEIASGACDRFPPDRFPRRFAATCAHQRSRNSAAPCPDRCGLDQANHRLAAPPIPRCGESFAAILECLSATPARSPVREQRRAPALEVCVIRGSAWPE